MGDPRRGCQRSLALARPAPSPVRRTHLGVLYPSASAKLSVSSSVATASCAASSGATRSAPPRASAYSRAKRACCRSSAPRAAPPGGSAAPRGSHGVGGSHEARWGAGARTAWAAARQGEGRRAGKARRVARSHTREDSGWGAGSHPRGEVLARVSRSAAAKARSAAQRGAAPALGTHRASPRRAPAPPARSLTPRGALAARRRRSSAGGHRRRGVRRGEAGCRRAARGGSGVSHVRHVESGTDEQ